MIFSISIFDVCYDFDAFGLYCGVHRSERVNTSPGIYYIFYGRHALAQDIKEGRKGLLRCQLHNKKAKRIV